jgi:hypothetical protein
MDSAGFQPLQIEEWRERLRKKSDEELIRFGRAALGMCSPEANFGHPPRSIFVDQLQDPCGVAAKAPRASRCYRKCVCYRSRTRALDRVP